MEVQVDHDDGQLAFGLELDQLLEKNPPQVSIYGVDDLVDQQDLRFSGKNEAQVKNRLLSCGQLFDFLIETNLCVTDKRVIEPG
ncbi:MAG: hypothetical protein OEY25_09090 [Candidatus Aminicenantes bacterium]|nr:hypothetical protein [Candidatus Aminicenantes bacterium]